LDDTGDGYFQEIRPHSQARRIILNIQLLSTAEHGQHVVDRRPR
jgi:hypothetical protein